MKLLEENTWEILQDKDVLAPSAHVTEAEKEKLKTKLKKKKLFVQQRKQMRENFLPLLCEDGLVSKVKGTQATQYKRTCGCAS